jgi:hypothetical protein
MFWISGGGNEKLKKKSKALAMTAWVQDSRAQDLPGPCSCSSATPVLVLYCKSIFIPLQPQSSRLHANTSFGPFPPAGQGRSACTLQKPESGDARSPGRNPSSNEEPAVASGTPCTVRFHHRLDSFSLSADLPTSPPHCSSEDFPPIIALTLLSSPHWPWRGRIFLFLVCLAAALFLHVQVPDPPLCPL